MRVGDGRLLAPAVTDWARVRAGAFRADTQGACTVKARKRSASRADSVDVEHGHRDRQLGDLRFVGRPQAPFDERYVGGGTAHVKGDDAVEPRAAGDVLRAQHSPGWAGEDSTHRLACRYGCANDSAAGLHDPHLSPSRVTPCPSLAGYVGRVMLDLGEITAQHRHQVGVDHSCGSALILAEFRQDLVRHGNLESLGA